MILMKKADASSTAIMTEQVLFFLSKLSVESVVIEKMKKQTLGSQNFYESRDNEKLIKRSEIAKGQTIKENETAGFRKHLYQSTKEKHNEIEVIFDLQSQVDEKKLAVLYTALLEARLHYKELLLQLDRHAQIETANLQLVDCLRADLGYPHEDFSVKQNAKFCLSESVGIFYVLAGSSMGAKVLLKMAQDELPDAPHHYLHTLSENSTSQMTTLKKLLKKGNLQPDQVITAALETFDFIHGSATSELRRRTQELESH